MDRAAEVYRHLIEADPTNEELAARLSALSSERADDGAEEEADLQARELSESGDEPHEVDTPFAWAEEPVDVADEGGPTIGDYLGGLLGSTPDVEAEES